MRMALLLLGILAAALLSGTSASLAIEYPWCLYYGGGNGNGGGKNCGFSTYERCMATAWGNGDICNENPFYTAPHSTPVPRKRKR